MKMIWSIILRLILIIGVVIAIVLFQRILNDFNNQNHIQQAALEAIPFKASQDADVKIQLDKRRKDYNRIKDLTVTEESIVHVVDLLEEQAKNQQVTMSIPKIDKKITFDKQGKPVPVNPKQMSDVRISIVANGDPAQLLQYLHYIETLPYIISLESWSLETASSITVGGSKNIIPESAEPEGVKRGVGYLEANILIGITNKTN